MNDMTGRHPSVVDGLARLHPGHLSDQPHLFELARPLFDVGNYYVGMLPDCPDLTEILRKLWEARNCALYVGAQHLAPMVQRQQEESVAGE